VHTSRPHPLAHDSLNCPRCFSNKHRHHFPPQRPNCSFATGIISVNKEREQIMNTHIASGLKSNGTTERRSRQRQQRLSPSLSLVFLILCFDLAPCIAFLQQCRPHLLPYEAARYSFMFAPRTTTPIVLSMAVAKSGGKIILDEVQFAKSVLDPDSTRPVMVFFTAPWYVARLQFAMQTKASLTEARFPCRTSNISSPRNKQTLGAVHVVFRLLLSRMS
jgi:hypothetical protein